ncbi:MAG TPA: bifunctional precorrin-2 dehydrogenase/sirohydrochlorin ferrochelatase [Thermodesulfovibrionales bacterium]|nr:bifunctional precorrin-2 dehydrogenase/sirohydrochlorin ferrochelatase [Thermodesulfovibrionales bacterium]
MRSPRTQRKRSPRSANRFSYPLFLDLNGRRCLVIGGGRVAERKCLPLMNSGALVTIVSPSLTKRLEGYKIKGLVKHKKREYRSSDIKSSFLVIAATNSEEINRQISRDAEAADKLLNVVDQPALCNFIVPSVVRRGLLTIAVSTGGASPAMAKAIRKELQQLYGPEFSRFLGLMKKLRSKAMKEITNRKQREAFLKELADRLFTG